MEVNKGVHEPQEEYAFQEVLRFLSLGATMLEVGAYWGYYSLWFLQTVKGGQAFLVEPESAHLEAGRRNFAINGTRADFTQAFVGAASDLSVNPPQICVDDFVREKKQLSHVPVLHSDIQDVSWKCFVAHGNCFLNGEWITSLFHPWDLAAFEVLGFS